MPTQSSRRRSSMSLHSPRSSPDRSSESSKSEHRSCHNSSTRIECHKVRQWLSEVTSVLDRPTIALTVFAIGVFFIILASKQVKQVFDVMEFLGVAVQVPYGFLYNFMAAFVFFVVWLDIIIFNKTVKWLLQAFNRAWSYMLKVKASMKEVENKERIFYDKSKKKRT